ncbi:hypothetical protein XENOCAPTIV_005976, partial [Xenoophorus captivus]
TECAFEKNATQRNFITMMQLLHLAIFVFVPKPNLEEKAIRYYTGKRNLDWRAAGIYHWI